MSAVGLRTMPISGFLLAGLIVAGTQMLAGQSLEEIPLRVIKETSGERVERTLVRTTSELRWSEVRRRLGADRIRVPVRPPTEFVLTPRAPYRVPGGYISAFRFSNAPSRTTTWHPATPDPTGHAHFTTNSYLLIKLQRVKPRTEYLLDISIDSGKRQELSAGKCGTTALIALAQFVVEGPQHVFLVVQTDDSENGCYRLWPPSGEEMALTRVKVSELGPAP